MTVTDIREDKKIVTFQTILTKPEDSDKVAITGEGKFIIPNLYVRDGGQQKVKKVEEEKEEVKVSEGQQFSNFPQISPKTIQSLEERGITHLFPVQSETFEYNFMDIWRGLNGLLEMM